MKKVQLGKSDIYVTPVTFGAWAIGGWMWGGADRKQAVEAIHASLDLGTSSIDTAPIYGFGRSEEIVGEAVNGRRDIEEELLPWSMKNDVSILAYSPLQRGLLTGKITPDYEFSEGDLRPNTPYFSPENIRLVNRFLNGIRPIADEHNVTIAQLVTAWTLAQPGITVALVGARNRKQVEDNSAVMNLNILEDEIALITDKLNQLKLKL
ncbi:MAG: aldo/keto reductase [Bacteroidales bacterium]